MEKTPKLQQKVSLSLRRNRKFRHSGSPQSCDRPDGASVSTVSRVHSTAVPPAPRPPSDSSECSTPPRKKFNLDETIDYSPKPFDTSFSPTTLLSQTLAIGSPEVGWKWGRSKITIVEKYSSITPCSAYEADSGFTSSDSVATEIVAHTRKDFPYLRKREEHRKLLELEMRRAEKIRADELLKKRCAKIQEQLLDDKETQNSNIIRDNKHFQLKEKTQNSQSSDIGTIRAIAPLTKINDTLDGFLNDSEIDNLLLEATQQVESDIVEGDEQHKPPKIMANINENDIYNTPTYSHREKRSSLYMKLLEDDSDDWFTQLDDVIEEAMNAKKGRNLFQRYKSMPTETSTTATGAANLTNGSSISTITSCSAKSNFDRILIEDNIDSAASVGIVSKLKRHASSHALSPSRTGGHCSGQLRLRK